MAVLLVVGSIAPAGATIGETGYGQSGATPSTSTVPVGATASTGTTATRSIDLTQELRLTPDAPGEITVKLRYSLPADVVHLKTRVPSEATVAATSGFVRREGTEYAWDERTSTPTLTYRIPANETFDVTGPIAGKGDYIFVDPGPWALVRVPPTATGWSWSGAGTVDISRTTTTAGPGAVGDTMAFLGDHREVTRTANGQTFRLVVPARASLAESPTAILDSMASAANTLQVGDRDERVFAVAAPTASTRWGVRGLQTGDADMWVRDVERLDTASNTWLHEYVHTRQDYAAAADVRWFTEASASYYAAFLALDQDRIGFDAFRERLALGTRTPDTTAVLADPATWDTVAPYTKGALVAGELDRQTRLATDRTRSLQNVLRRLNSHGDTVTGTVFREVVRQTGTDTTAALADRYTTTRETPSPWNRTAHEAFATTPARIAYALPDPETSSGSRVSGPYRVGPVGDERPIPLAVGEALTVGVRVTNTGGTTGEYATELLVNGNVQERRAGRLKPGASRTLAFTYRFAKPGEYTLAVGGEQVAVSVRPPAEPTVTGVEATQTTRDQQGRRAVSVTATVRNDRSFPAARNITLRLGGEPIDTRRVELGPNEERTISYDELLVEPGEHVFQVGEQTTVVTIDPPPTRTTESRTTTGAAGFGVVAVLVAVVGFLVVLGRRSR